MDRVEKIQYDRNYRKANREKLRAYEKARSGRPERQRDPAKLKARWRLRHAVRTGTIKKAKVCDECGLSGILDGHHNDYAKPLEVEWLCRSCHGKRHRLVL